MCIILQHWLMTSIAMALEEWLESHYDGVFNSLYQIKKMIQ